jgi:hypothetical protein
MERPPPRIRLKERELLKRRQNRFVIRGNKGERSSGAYRQRALLWKWFFHFQRLHFKKGERPLDEANPGKDSMIPVRSNWDSFQRADNVSGVQFMS